MFEGPCNCSNKVGTPKVATMSALDALQIYNSDDSEDVDVELSQSQPTSKPSPKYAIYDLKFKLEMLKLMRNGDKQPSATEKKFHGSMKQNCKNLQVMMLTTEKSSFLTIIKKCGLGQMFSKLSILGTPASLEYLLYRDSKKTQSWYIVTNSSDLLAVVHQSYFRKS